MIIIIYILKCVHGYNSFGPALFRNSFFWHYFTSHTNGKGVSRRDSARVTPKVKLCMHTMFKFVAPKICLVEVPFLAWYESRNGCGHIHILKTFPRLYWFQIYIYIWVNGSSSLGSSVFAEIPFLSFFSLTQEKEEVWPGGAQPMLVPEWSCICIPSFRSVTPRVFLAEYHIWLFLVIMVIIFWIFFIY